MTAFLPQNDPDLHARRRHLEGTRQQYQWNHSYISPLAMVEKVPDQDEWSWKWRLMVLHRVFDVLENQVAGHGLLKSIFGRLYRRFQRLVTYRSASSSMLKQTYDEVLSNLLGENRPDSIEDFGELFRTIGLPPISKHYRKDSVFANMRLAGPNPLVIERVRSRDDRFPVTDEQLQRVAPGDSLEAAMAEGRLYLADYQKLELLENGKVDGIQKYVYAPLSLYVVSKDTGDFLPVAIQCRQKPGSDNPVITPADGNNWLIAKTIVEMADGNFHEPVSHLGRTHLFVEPFVIATSRNLATRHPLYLLMRPHFEGTLAINDAAQRNLIAPGGPVDRLLGSTIETTKALVVADLQQYEFREAMLPRSFAQRGVESTTQLPNYAYRDDALLYWNAIRDWVHDYLSIYYPTDASISEDKELANWCRDLVSSEGGRVVGFGSAGTLNSVSELVDAATLVIYTSSVQHAAVNFPQFDLMSYCPNMPLAAYQPAPTSNSGASDSEYLDILPTMGQAEGQLNLLYVLGSVHYTTLGVYPPGHFADQKVREPLKRFQNRLAEIEAEIQQRNGTTRKGKEYKTLLPGAIPQSINI